jgi:hypothetical protein
MSHVGLRGHKRLIDGPRGTDDRHWQVALARTFWGAFFQMPSTRFSKSHQWEGDKELVISSDVSEASSTL